MRLPLRSTTAVTYAESSIFTLKYFGECMSCGFCRDWCCQFGCDVDLERRAAILRVEPLLASMVRATAGSWFESEEWEDPEVPGGRAVRVATFNGACSFRMAHGRGCAIHRLAVDTGRDYHELKPVVCWLFPLTFDGGVLKPAEEVRDGLVCAGTGVSLYEATRGELRVAFGDALVQELDALQAGLSRPRPRAEVR